MPNFNEREFKNKFIKIMKHIHGLKYDDFLLTSKNITTILKTNFIDTIFLYNMPNPKNYYITPKVDGEFKQFIVENSLVYIISYGVMIMYETNVPKIIQL